MTEDNLNNKTEDYKNNTAGFNSLLLLSLTSDAYFKWIPKEGVLVKPDMGAYTMIHPFSFSETNIETLSGAFENFITENRFSEQSRRIFRYFLFIAEDYSLYESSYAPILSELNRKCEHNGIIAEFDILDLKTGVLKTVDGKKMSDKKIRKIIDDTVIKYRKSQGLGISSETVIKEKKREVVKKYEELGEVRKVNFVNPMMLLILINVTVFIVGMVMEQSSGEDLFKTYGIQDNLLIMDGEWWRLITSMFLHSDFAHIAGNMLFLFYLGSITLRYYSSLEFYAVYFLSGLCGNLLSLCVTDYRSLGASGAIMGLGGLVIYRMFFGKNAKMFRKSGNYLIFALMIIFNLLYGVFAVEENINNYSHFGGFIGGFLIALLITYLRKLRSHKKRI